MVSSYMKENLVASLPGGQAVATEESSTIPAEGAGPRPRRRSREDNELYCSGEVNILVLDDDAAVCRFMATALGENDFSIDTVSEPSLMEAQIGSKNYHLVILDYVIPGLEFDKLVSRVRDLQPQASIIVVTAYPSMDSAVSCLRAGTFDYIKKPFEFTDLQQVVRRCLTGKGLLRMSEEALRDALGNAIRERRKGQGLTLAQLARRANVSLGYLSQIELGKNSASIETLYRIALALGVRLADLFQTVQPAM